MSEILVQVAQEMIPVIFTSERIERLKADLRGYRRRLREAGEREAAAYAHAATMLLEREGALAENRFLIGLCFVSLRLRLIALGEKAQAKARSDLESGEVES
jgi:hypothetical protein